MVERVWDWSRLETGGFGGHPFDGYEGCSVVRGTCTVRAQAADGQLRDVDWRNSGNNIGMEPTISHCSEHLEPTEAAWPVGSPL